jgi:hypothetical protein
MILSITFIFLVHHLVTYFMSTLTTPKIKDLVHGPQRKYKEIHDLLESKKGSLGVDHDSSSSTTRLQDLVNMNMLLREKEPEPFELVEPTSFELGSGKSLDYFSQLLERKEGIGKQDGFRNQEGFGQPEALESQDLPSMKSELKDFLHSQMHNQDASGPKDYYFTPL